MDPITRALRLAGLIAFLLVLSAASAHAQTGDITGTVTDAATGAPLFDADDPFGSGGVGIEVYTATGESYGGARVYQTSGAYQLSLPPGTYFVRAHATGYVSQLHAGMSCNAADCGATGGTPVTVTAGSTTVIDFALSEGARVSGTVRRAADGVPLFQVEVAIFNASGSLERSVSTSADGSYLFTGLTAGTHHARTDSGNVLVVRDFLDELYDGLPCPRLPFPYPDPGCVVTRGTPIEVPASGTLAGIDFALDPAPRLAGIVRNSTGDPIGSVEIVVLTGDTEVATARTNGAGEYSIATLPAGTYRVRTRLTPDASDANPGVIDQWVGGLCVGCAGTPAPVVLTAGTTTTVDFTLASNGGAIAGTLACCGGVVAVYDSAGALVRSRPFGPHGTSSAQVGPTPYTFAGLAPGTYYVRAFDEPTAPFVSPGPVRGDGGDYLHGGQYCAPEDCDVRRGTPVVVQAGQTTSGIDVPIRIGGRINVTVPDFQWAVEVFDARGVRLRDRVRLSVIPSYSVAGLPAGAYFLRIVPRPDAPDARGARQLYSGRICADCAVTSGTPVFVAEGGFANVDFPSATGRTVEGTVRDAADASGLSTIRVELVTRDGTVIKSDISDTTGLFRVRDLAPGTYFARTVNTRGYVDEVYDNVACGGCEPDRGTPIVVPADADVTGVDFSLVRGTLVTGAVTGATLPLLDAAVTLFSSGGAPAARARSTVFGEYLAAVPAGTTFARSDPVAGFRQELYQEIACPAGTCDPTSGTPIAVGTASVTGIDLTLDACSAMTIAPLRLANAAVGSAYRQTLTANGGTPPVVFTVAAGSLPPGLTLDSTTGVISGTPTTAGRYDLTAAAVDAAGCTATRAYTLDVPACAFYAPRTEFVVGPSATRNLVYVFDVCGEWTVESQASWIHIFSVVNQQTPPIVSGAIVDIDANTDPAPRHGTITIGPRALRFSQAAQGAPPPFGVVDLPADDAVVSGAIAITGWAVAEAGVSQILVYRDPVPGEFGLVLVGRATRVRGSRPDVQAIYGSYPEADTAGWGYMLLTNMLPGGGNGEYRLHAFATDNAGQVAALGSKRIVANNATATRPFGTIDLPDQGGSVSGTYVNWGWALTPLGQMIPTSGATIGVYVDGAPIGPLTRYDIYRSDVSTLFPGLANSSGPVGYRLLDTTVLEEGTHTIAWVVTDDGGRAGGIGSRYFEVRNSAGEVSFGTPSTADSAITVPPAVRGIDLARQAASLAEVPLWDGVVLRWHDEEGGAWKPLEPDDRGQREIIMTASGRIELDLSAGAGRACPSTHTGYLVANGELRPLPVGASVDPAAGRLYWQPGAGFVGRYRLLLVRTDCGGSRYRVPIDVVITGD